MDLQDKIMIIKKIDATDLSGEKVMIDFETGKYFLIKGAGNDIWEIIQNHITVKEIIDKLLTIYEVDEEECTRSVISFLMQMQKNGFISIGK